MTRNSENRHASETQRLSDGKFHRLGDDLLRRFDPRYRRLRTHGLNERGESIKGQPDSHVGDTAATCAVAVCYTAQQSAWWNKVVTDVREAVAASPTTKEVVIVIPHHADRDGPKDKTIDWPSSARAAAGEAALRVIDGREISRLLDTDHQDLRHEHLGIPCSRLSGPSILAGCRAASQRIIEDIRRSGRYDPTRYVPRSADLELYRLWQKVSRSAAAQTRRADPVRLIALVNERFGRRQDEPPLPIRPRHRLDPPRIDHSSQGSPRERRGRVGRLRHPVDPGAEAYSRLTFTTAHTRLERVGHRLADESVRDEFARRLAESDARMAAVVARTAVARFSPDIRRMIAEELGRRILARHRVRAAMAITLLGDLGCQEAIEVSAAHLLPPADVHRYLKALGATAFTKLGHAPAAPFVYR